MPPAVAAVVSTIMMKTFIAVASYVASRIIADATKPSTSSGDRAPVRGTLVNSCDPDRPKALIYGTQRVGVNKVYKAVAGGDNRFLHIIGEIGEGEIEGLVEKNGVGQVWLDDKLWNAYRGALNPEEGSHALVSYQVFTGSPTQQPCAALHAAIPEWNEAKRNTAYIYLRLEYDPNVFYGEPDVYVLVKGLKVYNPDTGLTAWTDNPALCARDFMVRSSRRGGMGIAAERIDDPSVLDTSSYCTAKGWKCNIAVIENRPVTDNLQNILRSYRGAVIFSGNEYKFRYRDLNYEAPVMDLTKDDVVESDGDSSLRVTQPSLFATPNAVRVRFCNKDKRYQEDDYILADQELADNDGQYREEVVECPGIDNLANAMRMAGYHLERLRVNKAVGFLGLGRTQALEPFDVVRFTHQVPGWSGDKIEYLRVESCKVDIDGNVSLEFSEEETRFYNDVYDLQDHNWHDTALPSPSDPVRSVRNIAATEEVYAVRDRSFTRLKITFDPPACETYAWWKHANVWVKIGEAGTYEYRAPVQSNYTLDPVEEGVTYFVRLVSESIHGAKEDFDSAPMVSRTILGKTTIPADLTAITAVASGDTLSVFGNPVAGADIVGYEFRLGNSFEGGILLGFAPSPMWQKSGMRPGTFTIFASPKDNAGHYSAVPKSASARILRPSGYVDKNTWSWNFGTGTFTNTEQATYGANTVLKCSQAGGVLSGSWLSPEYDLGAIKTVRVWGDFAVDYAASNLTWDVLWPPGALWTYEDITRSWGEIFSIGGAAVLTAKIKWGDNPGSLTNEALFFEISAPEFSARYVQLEITMTDPALDANLYLRALNMIAAYWSD